jgi:glycosyltransferase involved in cell wall biosynthesis
MKATVVITTKNRKEELRGALQSACRQTASPEIIVMDDGSTDGTAEMVRAEFPGVTLHSFHESKGYIIRRNEAACLASGEVIFSIDDDAVFSTSEVVEQTLCEFDVDRIGAVAIPYIEPRKDNVIRQHAPDRASEWVCADFIGTSHALRREVFLSLGGYPEHFVHQWEESDFCLRMMNSGRYVRCGCSDPILHYESPRRSFARMDYYGARNGVLLAWQNAPTALLPGRLLMAVASTFAHGLKVGRIGNLFLGALVGLVSCIKYAHKRRPVSMSCFQRFLSLRRNGPERFDDQLERC